jgi:hypothetical protein
MVEKSSREALEPSFIYIFLLEELYITTPARRPFLTFLSNSVSKILALTLYTFVILLSLYLSMSLEKISQLADEFVIKLAEHKYAEQAPTDIKADDLDWIDEETRQEIKQNGKKEEYKPFDKSHNPPGAVASEKTWNRAKKSVKKYWKNYDEPWAVVYDVYRKMGGKPKKKSKKK